MENPDRAVTDLVLLFKSGDLPAQRTFLAGCPPSRMQDTAMSTIGGPLDMILTSLNLLAETYCQGIDSELGIKLSEAIYRLSTEAYDANGIHTYLWIAANSA